MPQPIRQFEPRPAAPPHSRRASRWIISSLLLLNATTGCTSASPEDLASVTQALAAPLHLRPAADAHVVSGANSESNYGDATTLQVRLNRSGQAEVRSFLRFELGSVAGKIGRARLRLSALDGSAVSTDVLATPNAVWDEDTINWTNQPRLEGAPRVDSIAGTTVGESVYLDVTRFVAPNTDVGFALRAASRGATSFASREHPKDPVFRRPSLILDQITTCHPAVTTPSLPERCSEAPIAQSPTELLANELDVAPGVTVTQLTNDASGMNNIAYYDIPALIPGSDRFIYSRADSNPYTPENYTATMTLDGFDARLLSPEPASAANTFVTPDGATAYFPRWAADSKRVQIVGMDLTGTSCGVTPLTPSRTLHDDCLGSEKVSCVAQLSTPSRNCETDKWVIAYATNFVVHRIKGKSAGTPWPEMSRHVLKKAVGEDGEGQPDTRPFHNLRLSPTCPNILMYSRNRPKSEGGAGDKEVYLVDLDRDLSPYYLAYGENARLADLTGCERAFPSHTMWSHDGLRVSYTQQFGCTAGERRLMIAHVVNSDCTLRTFDYDTGEANLMGDAGIKGRTFNARRIDTVSTELPYFPKFCSWSANDDFLACSGHDPNGEDPHGGNTRCSTADTECEDEGPSALFLVNVETGATQYLSMTGERPGSKPYQGQSHLQFAGNDTTLLFDSDRFADGAYLPPQVYKLSFPRSLLR
jgi:hypothetical protein